MTTRAQRLALARLFNRAYDCTYEDAADLLRHYRAFRRRFRMSGTRNDRYLFGNIWNMWIGIEADGYTHS